MEGALEIYSIDNSFEKRGLKCGDRVVVDPRAPVEHGNIVLFQVVGGDRFVCEVEVNSQQIICRDYLDHWETKTGFFKVVGVREK